MLANHGMGKDSEMHPTYPKTFRADAERASAHYNRV